MPGSRSGRRSRCLKTCIFSLYPWMLCAFLLHISQKTNFLSAPIQMNVSSSFPPSRRKNDPVKGHDAPAAPMPRTIHAQRLLLMDCRKRKTPDNCGFPRDGWKKACLVSERSLTTQPEENDPASMCRVSFHRGTLGGAAMKKHTPPLRARSYARHPALRADASALPGVFDAPSPTVSGRHHLLSGTKAGTPQCSKTSFPSPTSPHDSGTSAVFRAIVTNRRFPKAACSSRNAHMTSVPLPVGLSAPRAVRLFPVTETPPNLQKKTSTPLTTATFFHGLSGRKTSVLSIERTFFQISYPRCSSFPFSFSEKYGVFFRRRSRAKVGRFCKENTVPPFSTPKRGLLKRRHLSYEQQGRFLSVRKKRSRDAPVLQTSASSWPAPRQKAVLC